MILKLFSVNMPFSFHAMLLLVFEACKPRESSLRVLLAKSGFFRYMRCSALLQKHSQLVDNE